MADHDTLRHLADRIQARAGATGDAFDPRRELRLPDENKLSRRSSSDALVRVSILRLVGSRQRENESTTKLLFPSGSLAAAQSQTMIHAKNETFV
jgi:hypothetical protein